MPVKHKKGEQKPEFYPSCGDLLRDAVSGDYFPFKKGSIGERSLFKSRFVNGTLNNAGFLQPQGCFYKDQPVDAYFRTPKQYEKFFGTKLDQSIHDKWLARQPVLNPNETTDSESSGKRTITIK